MGMDVAAVLRNAGWTPERRTDVTVGVALLTAEGYPVSARVVAFLEAFSGLRLVGAEPGRIIWVDGAEAATDSDPEWCAAYSAAIGRPLVPIGGYSHMTIFIDDRGEFWGGFDHLYGRLGGSLQDVILDLLIHPGTRTFDRQLPEDC
jgi:hypothetical protein